MKKVLNRLVDDNVFKKLGFTPSCIDTNGASGFWEKDNYSVSYFTHKCDSAALRYKAFITLDILETRSVLFNGKIYNEAELKKVLQQTGVIEEDKHYEIQKSKI